LPNLKQMAEDAYQLGQSSLLEVLDASRSRTETKLTYLDLLSDEINAELDALTASGLLVSSIEPSNKASSKP
jgi:outer membrane protein, heavy metal efflux system